MAPHPLAGHFPVLSSAQRIRHYRYAEERMMRIMGGWIALTPELPAKLVLGRHVWDCAQHADAWGKRLPELREPAQQSEPAGERFVAFMDLLESAEAPGQTLERLTAVYRVLKPRLVAAYQAHLAVANPIYEPPTRRILQRCLDEERRHVAAGRTVLELLTARPGDVERVDAWQRRLADALAAAGGVTGEGDVTTGAGVDVRGVDTAGDLVAVGSRFERSRVEPDLLAAVEAHARAVVADDRAGAEACVVPEARGRVRDEYGRARVGCETAEVVACAKIGRHRMVKLALAGPAGRAVVQLQWRHVDGSWRLVDAAVVGVDPPR
jgi:hypothetical protein